MYSLSYPTLKVHYLTLIPSAMMYTDDCWTNSAYVFSLVECQTFLTETMLWTELPCVVHLCTFEAANWILQWCSPLFMNPSHSWLPVVKSESTSKSPNTILESYLWFTPDACTSWFGCVAWVVRPMPSSNSHRMRLECGTVLDCWSTKTSEVCLLNNLVNIAYKQNHKPRNTLLIEIEE